MAETIELKATARERVGKGAARGLRRDGRVPAVIYGDKQSAEPIVLDYKDVWKHYQSGRFFQTLYLIDVGGKKTRVLPREAQVDPVRDFLTHVDFLRVAKDAQIRVAIPVSFRNHDKSPGLKRGGVLNVVRHDVELYCPADAIPTSIEVNLDGLEIGNSVHISAVELPAGTRPVIADRDFTIATIAGAVAETAETTTTAEGAAPAEGEAATAAAAPADDKKDAKAAPAKDEKKK